jgi:hypothetical protein
MVLEKFLIIDGALLEKDFGEKRTGALLEKDPENKFSGPFKNKIFEGFGEKLRGF